MSGVFVDDYCLAAVENHERTLLKRVSRAALHTIHAIFPPPAVTGHVDGKDSISRKKVERGDVRFAPIKEMLGFELNGKARTVQLPKSKAQSIVKEIKAVLKKSRVRLVRMQRTVGRLQHASLVMPCSKALFTPLYDAMKGDPKYIYLPVGGKVRNALRDAIALTLEAAERPTHVREIVAGDTGAVGNCDASAFGAGGVWYGGSELKEPIVWRVVFPADIQQSVVSDDNPRGTVTNSDLELAAILLHHLVLEQAMGMRHVKTVTFSDNTPAVAWVSKMHTKAESDISYNLLRGIAMRQRTTESVMPEVMHVEQQFNVPADIASRRIAAQNGPAFMNETSTGLASVKDCHFLSYYNSRFPLSQNLSWRLVHPTPALLSRVISTLRGKPSTLQQWTTKQERQAGQTGQPIVQPLAKIPTCDVKPSKASNGSSWRLPPGFERATSGSESKFNKAVSRKPSVTWAKPSCWQDSQTRDDPMVPRNWIWPSDTR